MRKMCPYCKTLIQVEYGPLWERFLQHLRNEPERFVGLKEVEITDMAHTICKGSGRESTNCTWS